MKPWVRGAARWSVLVLGIGLALVYLNSAAYSWWASWGPPTRVPEAWEHRAATHLCVGLAVVLFSFALSRTLRPSLRADRVVWLSLALGALLAALPHLGEFVAADRCLDGGGRWNSDAYICEYAVAPGGTER